MTVPVIPCIALVRDQKVDVIRRDDEVQDAQAIKALGGKHPMQPRPLIFGALKKEFPFMASLGDVPNESRDIMPVCARHDLDYPSNGKDACRQVDQSGLFS